MYNLPQKVYSDLQMRRTTTDGTTRIRALEEVYSVQQDIFVGHSSWHHLDSPLYTMRHVPMRTE
jgi:hypothetical protein